MQKRKSQKPPVAEKYGLTLNNKRPRKTKKQKDYESPDEEVSEDSNFEMNKSL